MKEVGELDDGNGLPLVHSPTASSVSRGKCVRAASDLSRLLDEAKQILRRLSQGLGDTKVHKIVGKLHRQDALLLAPARSDPTILSSYFIKPLAPFIATT